MSVGREEPQGIAWVRGQPRGEGGPGGAPGLGWVRGQPRGEGGSGGAPG